MIYATCRTSIDSFKNESFPYVFAEIPKKGDLIRCLSGRELMVVNITHLFSVPSTLENPFLVEIELSEVPIYSSNKKTLY